MHDDAGPSVDDTLPVPSRRRPRRPPLPYGYRVGMRLAVATLSFVVLAGSGLAWVTYQGFSADVPHGDAVPALAAGQRDLDGKDQNILLIGNDSRSGDTPAELAQLSTTDDGGSVNTDTTMVLHIPADGSRATIVSFPRDSWVSIPGYGKGKLNSAYGDGYAAAKQKHPDEVAAESSGIKVLIETLSGLTGLHIDHYMQVNLLGFYRISEVVGGVRVCLLHAQNAETDSDAFGKGYSGIDLPAGWSSIEGKQALAFVRQRHGLPGGDLDRIKRQQYFLAAAFTKIASAGTLLNPFRLHSLLSAVSSSLLTDPDLDLLSLAGKFADLSSGNVAFTTIPNGGPQTIYPDGVMTSIVGIDTGAIPGFVNTLLGRAADPALAATTAALATAVTLDVLNGTSAAGLAARNATLLRARGFTIDTVDSADPTAATTIDYPPGQQAQAKAVAMAVPAASLVLTSSVKRVTLVLGSDGAEVNQSAGPKQPTVPPAGSTAPTSTSTSGCIN
jgi:LCP family protein required for cell wall assembly